MPPKRRGRGRAGSCPSDSKPPALPLRRTTQRRRSSVKRGRVETIHFRSKSKASEGASQSVTRSVSSSSSLSTEVSSDSDSGNSYTRALVEAYGCWNSDTDSDGQCGGTELDEQGKQYATIADSLPCDGLMMLLFETPTGFALFTFSGVCLYLPDSMDTLWAEFADPHKAIWMAYPKGILSFEDKSSAITDAGVDKQLADMINKWHLPGMKLCVAKPEYERIIESKLKIPCKCCQAVMEIMWGIQQQMRLYFPRVKLELTEEDRLPMSQGLKKFLSSYGYDVKPEMVNEKIVKTACSLLHYDEEDDKNLALLRDAGLNIRDISGIACADWDIVKLAIAVKVIYCPEEELTDFHGVLGEDVVSKLKGDAPKYKRLPLRILWLRASKAAVSNHHLRIAKEKLLSSLVKEAKEAYEATHTRLNRKLYGNSGEGSHKRPKYLGARGTPVAMDD